MRTVLIAAVFLTLFASAGSAQITEIQRSAVKPAAISTLTLTSQQNTYDLAPVIYTIDTPGLTFAEAADTYRRAQAAKNTFGKTARTGFGSTPRWFLFTVHNRTQAKTQWFLSLGQGFLNTSNTVNKIEIYESTSLEPIMSEGRMLKNKQHVPGQRDNIIPVTLNPGQGKIFAIYIEPTHGKPFAFTPVFLEREAGEDSISAFSAKQALMWALISGVIMFLVFFNLSRNHPAVYWLAVYIAMIGFTINVGGEIIPYGNNWGAYFIVWLKAFIAIAAMHTVIDRLSPMPKHQGNSMLFVISLILYALGWASLADSRIGHSAEMIMNAIVPFVYHGLILMVIANQLHKAVNGSRSKHVASLVTWLLSLGAFGMVFIATIIPSADIISAQQISAALMAAHMALLVFSMVVFIRRDEKAFFLQTQETRAREEQDTELRRAKEMRDQAQLVNVLKRERELMAELREREAERLHAMREAKEISDEANKAKGSFLAMMSHEIRTPLTGIMGMVKLLLDTRLDDRQLEYAETIQYSGDALLALLNDILDLSKIEEGKMEIESVNFDMKRLLNSLILLMSGRATEKKIGLSLDLQGDIPALMKGDPTRLRQVLLNLLSNAIKFTDRGEVKLIVRPEGTEGDMTRVYFGVKDTGIGISEDAQKDLFAPFKQANATIARRFGGTGLGLAICKKLVQGMGGTIKVDSKMGHGSTFHFTINLLQGSEEDADEAESRNSNGTPSLNILVVDDNHINQKVLRGLLEKDGHTVTTAGNGVEALKEIETTVFDVTLMDMEMPEMDGVTATGHIRASEDPARKNMIVIALTANVMKEDIERCMAAGMNDYVAKPIDPEGLSNMMHRQAVALGYVKGAKLAIPESEAASEERESAAASTPITADDIAPSSVSGESAAQQPAASGHSERQAEPAITSATVAAPADEASSAQPTPLSSGFSTKKIDAESAALALGMAEDTASSVYVPMPPPSKDDDTAAASPPAPPPTTFLDKAATTYNKVMLTDLRKSLGDAMLKEMLDELFAKAEELIMLCDAALTNGDYKTLSTRGHDLKGMCANFGLTGLSTLASEIEKNGKIDGNQDTLGVRVAKLRPTYENTRKEVENFLGGG